MRPAGQQCMRSRRREQGEAGARRQANPDFGMCATRGEQRLHVFDQRSAREYRGAGVAQFLMTSANA